MGDLPSYLNPPNFIGAMQAGAHAGLAAREQDVQQQSAADRLRLAYDQIAKQEQIASMQAMARQKQGEAALALRAGIASQQALLRDRQITDMENRTKDMLQRNYGEPTIMDLGGGNKFIYRKGSPGGHLMKEYHPKATLRYGPNGEFQGVSGDPSAPDIATLRQASEEKKAADDLAAQQPSWFSQKFLGKKPTPAPQKKFKVLAVDGKPVEDLDPETGE